MIFTPTKISGAFIIDPEPIKDERGFFARSWCKKEFAAHGVNENLVQCNISYNHSKGTLRGMHLQASPFQEAKLVRCTRGAIWDVIVDLRPGSESYLRHVSAELTDENRSMLYVPKGFAHGFITLKNQTEVFYQMSEYYSPEHALGYRYDDPAFNIELPIEIKVISDRDRSYPDFRP